MTAADPRLKCPSCGAAPRIPVPLTREIRCRGCGARLHVALVTAFTTLLAGAASALYTAAAHIGAALDVLWRSSNEYKVTRCCSWPNADAAGCSESLIWSAEHDSPREAP